MRRINAGRNLFFLTPVSNPDYESVMLIIDSQVHIWAPETAEKPYAREDASPPHRPVPLGHEELLREMDGAGVARCVLVPPTWEADRNDTSLEAARLHPDRFRVMGRLALTKAGKPRAHGDVEKSAVYVGHQDGF